MRARASLFVGLLLLIVAGLSVRQQVSGIQTPSPVLKTVHLVLDPNHVAATDPPRVKPPATPVSSPVPYIAKKTPSVRIILGVRIVGNGMLAWPIHGYITQYFSAHHPALDIAANEGTPVGAACKGRIIWAGWKTNGGGNVVDIACNNGLIVSNNHLSAISVKLSQAVVVGTMIGRVGETGWATGPHLHFQVINHGIYVNPLRYF